jgi:hypothetical protein
MGGMGGGGVKLAGVTAVGFDVNIDLDIHKKT